MGEYRDLYLKSDVLLSADVFEKFRKTCMQYYKLDPCHYFTSPRLSWDAILKMADIKLELIIDVKGFSSMKRVCVVKCLTQPIVMARQTINT